MMMIIHADYVRYVYSVPWRFLTTVFNIGYLAMLSVYVVGEQTLVLNVLNCSLFFSWCLFNDFCLKVYLLCVLC